MAFAGFNEETLAAMQQQQGGADATPQNTGDVPSDTPAPDGADTPPDMPDIEFHDIQDKGEDPEETPGSPPDKPKPDTPDEPPKADGDPGKEEPAEGTSDLKSDEAVSKIVTDAGLDTKELSAQVIKDGGFSDELIAGLKEKIDPGLVDAYVEQFNAQLADAKANQGDTPEAGQNAERQAQNAAREQMNKFIYDSVGGEDKFGTLAGVLKSNLPQAEIDVINTKLASDNKDLVREGLKQAVDAYKTATGRSNTRMSGDVTSTADPAFQFMTKEDFHAIMKTDKYKTDPVYAAKVDADRLKSKQMDAQQTLPGQYRAVRNGRMYNL